MENLQPYAENDLNILTDLTEDEKKVLGMISTEGTPALSLYKMASSRGIYMPLSVIKDVVNNPNGLVKKEMINSILTYFRLR